MRTAHEIILSYVNRRMAGESLGEYANVDERSLHAGEMASSYKGRQNALIK